MRLNDAEILGLVATNGRLMVALKETEDALSAAHARVAELEHQQELHPLASEPAKPVDQ
jgi:hypothetical protein